MWKKITQIICCNLLVVPVSSCPYLNPVYLNGIKYQMTAKIEYLSHILNMLVFLIDFVSLMIVVFVLIVFYVIARE